MQMIKKEINPNVFQLPMPELLCTSFFRNTCYLEILSVLSLPNDTEGSKRTVTLICIFNLQLKSRQEIKKGKIFM